MAQELINPIQNLSYTSKDFETIYPELLDLVKQLTYKWDPSQSNESDPGVLLLKLMAIFEDKCNYNIDKNILECFPASVTQETNARRLFEQLGYYMHWYRGATTDISLTMNTKEAGLKYTVPAFTMVSDADKSVVYTLLGSSTSSLLEDEFIVEDKEIEEGITQLFKAIQGVAVDYSVATTNNKLITVANLDSNNRLYFNSVDIAENGVFIHNADENNYSAWKRKDNLLTEELGNTFYKFGVTADGTACFLEFPTDAEQIFKSGIYVTYIKTLGASGNIAATLINTPYADLVTTDGLTLTADNLKIVNSSSATNGKDKELINEAYTNYKRTIGTFDTLVTLRDYVNAIRNSGLVGNAVVTDRTNDIQQTYKIQTLQNGINQAKTMIEPTYVKKKKRDGTEVEVEEPSLSAFSLKLYLLQIYKAQDSLLYYNTSFNPCSDAVKEALIGTATEDGYLTDTKLISHDFTDLVSPNETQSHICYFKNKYPLEIKVIPQYTLSTAQQKEVVEAIKKALYNNLNSEMVEFGSEISLDYVNQIILSADSRVKSAIIGNINYTTYAVYKDEEGTFHEVVLNDTDEELVDAIVYRDDKVQSKIIVTVDYETYYNKTYDGTEKYITTQWYKKSDGWHKDSETSPVVDISTYGITFNSSQTFEKNEENQYVIDRDITLGQTINVTSVVIKSQVIDPTQYTVNLNTVSFKNPKTIPNNAKITVNFEEPIWPGDELDTRISYKTQFRNEIYTKSVLAGATQFYIQDETFDYKLNQVAGTDAVPDSIIKNIREVKGSVSLSLSATGQNESKPLTLRSNEAIQFYAPNLLDQKKYSNYVRYIYYTGSDTETIIEANADHQLKANERICFFWRESDDLASEFTWCCYGEGNIIKPSFKMTSNNAVKWVAGLTLNGETKIGEGETYGTQKQDVQDEAGILSGSKSAIRRIVNTVTLPDDGTYSLYWITENTVTEDDIDKYILFDSNEIERVLSANEYLIYTNDNGDTMQILGSGTTILRQESEKANRWAVIAVSAESILTDGASAIEKANLYSYWWNLKQCTLTLTENQFVSLTSGTQLIMTCNNKEIVSPTETWKATFTDKGVVFYVDGTKTDDLSLSDFTIQYKRNTASDTKKESLSSINITAGSWNAKSLLNIYISPTEPLRLLDGQTLYYKLKEDTGQAGGSIAGKAKGTHEYPQVILSSSIISNSTPEFKVVTTYDDNGNLVYPSLYNYKEQINNIDEDITYTTDGRVQLRIKKEAGLSVTKTIPFAMPKGDYILKVTNGGVGTMKFYLDDSQLSDMYDRTEFGQDSYYLHISLAGPTQYTLKVVVTNNIQDCSIVLANPYKYDLDKLGIDDIATTVIQRLIKFFDTEKIFDFTYVVPDSNKVQKPLEAKSFNNSAHIYNKFTICQLDTTDIGNNITTV